MLPLIGRVFLVILLAKAATLSARDIVGLFVRIQVSLGTYFSF